MIARRFEQRDVLCCSIVQWTGSSRQFASAVRQAPTSDQPKRALDTPILRYFFGDRIVAGESVIVTVRLFEVLIALKACRTAV